MYTIGLDISKGYADVVFAENKKVIGKPFLVDDTNNGYSTLEKRISELPKEEVIKVGFESTGGYENNFLNFFLKIRDKYNLKVFRLNPLSVKRYSQVDVHNPKTDKTNAKDIAFYLYDKEKLIEIEEINDEMEGLKKLIKRVEKDNKILVGLKNELLMLIQQIFPEIIKYCRYGIPKWVLEIFKKYPTTEKLKKAKVDDLKEIKYIKKNNIEKIIELAKESAGCLKNYNIGVYAKLLCERILEMRKSIDILKEIIEEEYKKIENNKISTIFGIGTYSACIITAYSGNIKRFKDVKQYIAYFGLDPRIEDSGDKIQKRKITKKGSPVIRKILYTSVMSCLINSEHPVTKTYRRLKNRGLHHYSVMVACMRKMLSIIYGILKNNKDFDINYENTEKSEEQSNNDIKKVRTKSCESFDIDAPISKKEKNRRIKAALSQNVEARSLNINNGINATEYNI